mmetsp:Transcript_81495/g.230930  ORF Transcript_81495/g.230930 Transcript_81495/m.230930 type:complete len:281 (-) Transcript_81495:449-1291(-)
MESPASLSARSSWIRMRTGFGGMASSFSVRVTSQRTSTPPLDTMRTLSSRGSSLRISCPGATCTAVATLESSSRAFVTALDSFLSASCGSPRPVCFVTEGSGCVMRASAGTCFTSCAIRRLPMALSAKAASRTCGLRIPTMQGSSQRAAPAAPSARASSPSRKPLSPKTAPCRASAISPPPPGSGKSATRPESRRNARPSSLGQAALPPPKTQRSWDSLRKGIARSSLSSCRSSKRWKSSGWTCRSSCASSFSWARRSACILAGTRRPAFSVVSTNCRVR